MFSVYKTSCARGDTICPRPTRCTYAAAHLQSILHALRLGAQPRPTQTRRSAPYAMNIRNRQAAARSGRWRRNWSRRYVVT